MKRYILFLVFTVMAIGIMPAQVINDQNAEIVNTATEDNDENSNAPDSIDQNSMAYDSVVVSILTCTPGEDVYSKFGHTALRVKNCTRGYDDVFNYGCFNYNSENFLMKFILGQTDYLLQAEPTLYFMSRYQSMGNGVTEQVLNLTQDEANCLLSLLVENLMPQNQEYRYKWIGNNCTDKARFVVEDAVKGTVEYDYSNANNDPTVREILHECLKEVPWVKLGVDLLLGQEIDNGIIQNNVSTEEKHRLKMFIPAIFMEEADKAKIARKDGSQVPYVAAKNVLLVQTYSESAPSPLTPTVVFGVLLLSVAAISIYDFKRKVKSMWLDITLCISQGLLGTLLTFLFFFSAHPGVNSNWLVIVFNPVALFYAGYLVYCHVKHKKNKLASVNLSVLVLFLLTMVLCPQAFNPAIYMMVLSLTIRGYVQKAIAN